MSDITNLFKATVKTVKVQQKVQGTVFGPDKSILGTAKNKSEFALQAKDVVTTISKLRDFLVQHRKEYINANGHVGVEQSKMSDADRDQIDQDTEVFVKRCADAIRSLRSQAHAHKVLPQTKEHKEGVLELIDVYLKTVCRLYSEQRAIRVKRVVDRKRISRLEPEGIKRQKAEMSLSWVNKTEGTEAAPRAEGPDLKAGTSVSLPDRLQSVPHGDVKSITVLPSAGLPPTPCDDVIELSPEEAQLFHLENEQLYEEMSSMVDEVRQIEGKIVEIARLQEIFADKVLEQETQIDTIADTVVGSTENIKEGNEEIREAMKNNAGFRIWILFFLIVCSFSLLFLDWYNT